MNSELNSGTPKIEVGQIWFRSNFETLIHVDKIENGKVHYSRVNNYDVSKLSHYGSNTEEQFLRDNTLLTIPLDKALELGEQIIRGEIKYEIAVENESDYENQSALVSADAKQTLVAKVNQLQQTQAGLENMRACFMLSMQKKKAELDLIRQSMNQQLSSIKNLMRRIVKVIESIELYLGVNEEMTRFQEGDFADINEPIIFRQLVLYMDEEVANTKSGGFDINNLEDFENWLRVPENLQQVMPDKKGIVAFKPRRYKKQYGDAWLDSCMAQHNNKTFFLIRNGDNLTHIFASNLQCGKTMFPGQSGMAEMQKRAQSGWDSDKEKVKEEIQDQARLALFFQGLIDRSDVFKPHAPVINIFEDGAQGIVRFLYDAEDLLPDGRMRFNEWRKEINSFIERGSRIVVVNAPSYSEQYPEGERFARYYSNSYRAPRPPFDGLYSVNESFNGGRTGKEQRLYILYNPKDTVYTWTDYGERKNSLSFEIRREDDFILNYDHIDLQDIEFYLQNRIDRPNYLSMMPVLRELKVRRLKEMFAENEFAKAMSFQCKVSEQTVLDAIDWWKMKVIMKRPLDKDDAKAWRMIKSKILREK